MSFTELPSNFSISSLANGVEHDHDIRTPHANPSYDCPTQVSTSTSATVPSLRDQHHHMKLVDITEESGARGTFDFVSHQGAQPLTTNEPVLAENQQYLFNTGQHLYNDQVSPQQSCLLESSYNTGNPTNLDLGSDWLDSHSNPSSYEYGDNNNILPTQQSNQVQRPHQFPDSIQNVANMILPSPFQYPSIQRYDNFTTIGHHPLTMNSPFPPQLLPVMTSQRHDSLIPAKTLVPPPTPKRKRDSEDVDSALQHTRSRKRRAPVKVVMPAPEPSSSTNPDKLDILRNSLPANDPRNILPCLVTQDKQKTKLNNYKCLYSGPAQIGGNDSCGEIIQSSCQRNWFRHFSGHAADEESMLKAGTLQVEQVYALLWVKKNVFVCPVPECGFSAEAWRVDGITKRHMTRCHPDFKAKRQKRGEGEGKENG
ncbi:hypothetical protein Clacol_005026 [Clathrus columnatus]|uniref:C2H2-type domain-containing protein n=1 Tax=Clathrus columnatus TaxID=1419009 RepID=A0AAV5ADS0_9AGAM|nr:hypothetical protein Clacol_005026 [Clathrus columnatus]